MGNFLSNEAVSAKRASQQDAGGGSEGAAAVTLKLSHVKVPKDRLKTESEEARISRLLRLECLKGQLVDRGGSSAGRGQGQQVNTALVCEGHTHGFIAAVTSAFKDHYPLSLRPQHVWLLVLQAVARHVDQHSEHLQPRWTKHSGSETLNVSCDEFILAAPEGNDWASIVSGRPHCFSSQMGELMQEGVCDMVLPSFTDTETVEHLAMQITVMDICKNFFDYKCTTSCGFPSVTLEGCEADWALLRSASEQLVTALCTEDMAQSWLPSLLPLLDKLLQQYQAAASPPQSLPGRILSNHHSIDVLFWNSMCKLGGTNGSGSRTWFNGWMNVFFPLLGGGERNPYCVPYSPRNGYAREGLVWDKRYPSFGKNAPPEGVPGPDCEDFPHGLGRAPVSWSYLGRSPMPLQFVAGFLGAAQHPDTLVVSPHVGWFISKGEESDS